MHWILGAGQPTVDEAGEVTGTIGACADVTARVLVEQERDRLLAEAVEAAEVERVSRERLEFLTRHQRCAGRCARPPRHRGPGHGGRGSPPGRLVLDLRPADP